MLGELIPTGGGDAIPLMKPRILIGRRPTCDICLPYPNVSSQHCELQLQNGYWHVTDLNSSNGIKVNGVRDDSKYLQPGDELSIAKHVFEVSYTPAADAVLPEEDENPFGGSLMEKAGLVSKKKRKKPPGSQADDVIGDATNTPIQTPPKKTGNKQEDDILGWLSDD